MTGRLRRAFRLAGVLATSGAAWGLTATRKTVALDAEPADLPPSQRVSEGLLDAIGNTPLVELRSLSRATGRRILAKAEHLNPGGSVKDRPARQIVREAEAAGLLSPRDARAPTDPVPIIVEATGGNTGVGLALVAAARGYRCIFTMPANISDEKVQQARTLGAEVIVCPLVPFSDPRHFYHAAAALAERTPHAVLGRQFESLANMRAHLQTTGPEIWAQAGGRVDAFVCASGTGGTIAGVGTFLRSVNPDVRLFLIDPPGSALAHFVRTGRFEGAPGGSTVAEGVGIARLTANFAAIAPHIDPQEGVFDGVDAEAVAMSFYLLQREGLWVGPSAALNVVGAVKAARKLPPGSTVVTVLCDGGERYKSKLYLREWLQARPELARAAEVDASRDHADFVS